MIRLIVYLVLSLLVALGAAWLIALPGTVEIAFGSWRMSPGLGLALFIAIGVIIASILIWAIIRRLIDAPAALARSTARRRERAGVEALSDGMIALQAGEFSRARMLARDARAKLPENPAAQLLEARAELALGDLSSAREHYRALISNERTALAALSGLYEQARTQERGNAAITFARMAIEETEPDTAYDHASRALKSIPDFVPAALVAARILINRGDTRRASALLRRTWRAGFHPDAATLYAHVKPGTSALERLKRIRTLIESPQSHPMAAIVLARAAIDAYEWSVARNALAPFLVKPTRQMCLLMAEIEEGQSGDQGKAREWLSRAVSAPADPTWTADGITSDEWAPASPVTGRLDAFEWKVPVQTRALVKTLSSSPASEAGAALPAIEDAATPTKTQP